MTSEHRARGGSHHPERPEADSRAEENKDKFLICQRPAHKARGLLWEFPGGKIEAGENAEEALRREIQEELGCGLQLVLPFDTIESDYPDFHLSMEVFVCTLTPQSTPSPKEHAELRWITKDDITSVDWLSADRKAATELGMFWDMFFESEHL